MLFLYHIDGGIISGSNYRSAKSAFGCGGACAAHLQYNLEWMGVRCEFAFAPRESISVTTILLADAFGRGNTRRHYA